MIPPAESTSFAFLTSFSIIFTLKVNIVERRDGLFFPEFQGMGVGSTIMRHILSRISHCNVILYASPGKEGFYQDHGFRKMKTGMARFTKGAAMRERGFTE